MTQIKAAAARGSIDGRSFLPISRWRQGFRHRAHGSRPSPNGWLRPGERGRTRCSRASIAFDRSTVTSRRGSRCFRRTRQLLAR